jgi:hypothetical protein
VVVVTPGAESGGNIVELIGTKTITGTPTAAGQAAGCAAYSLTYNAVLTI